MYIPLPGMFAYSEQGLCTTFYYFSGIMEHISTKAELLFSFPSHIVYNRDNGYYEPGRDIRRGKQEISAYQGGTYAKRNMDIQEK